MYKRREAFTLAELIITITILVVLATMSFVALQGYGKDARNTKRITDTSSISNSILIQAVKGNQQMKLIGGNNENKADFNYIDIGGRTATSGIYKTGIPKYSALGIKKDDFLDPNGKDYRIGATSTYGGRYEVVTRLEIDEGLQTHILGNYHPRSVKTFNVSDAFKNFVTLNSSATNHFKKDDLLTTNEGTNITVKRILSDKSTLVFDTDMTGITSLELALPETAGLLATKDDDSILVTHGSKTNFVY